MTDEEKKAEEYADKMLSNPNYPFIFSKEEVKVCIIKVYLDSLKCCENAYNKGFAEGKPKWHDLREDPNDLPIKNGQYWTKYDDTSEERGGFYDVHYFEPDKPFYKKHWSEIDVIAWTELPKFEEV